ncbi:hypothetical protein [Actinomadura gamaensis]|uniref:Uncharacterized protein n=1 Tax=Actinomadura gamaensis TaxID=1763541 RepID=A0ABV9UBY8_9ACTN
MLAERLAQLGWSIRRAARESEYSEGRWRQVVKGYEGRGGGAVRAVHASADTLASMAQTLDLSPEQLDGVGRPDAAEKLRELIARNDLRASVLRDLGDDPEVLAALDRLPPSVREDAVAEIVRLHERVREDTRRYVSTLLNATRVDDEG